MLLVEIGARRCGKHLCPCFYRLDCLPELLYILVRVYGLVDIRSLMPHELIADCPIHASPVKQHIEGVSAVVRGMLCLDATGLQGGIEVFPVLDFCYAISVCMIDQAVKLSAISAAYHWIYG